MNLRRIPMVEVTGLEPAASWSQTVELNFFWYFLMVFNPFRYISLTL